MKQIGWLAGGVVIGFLLGGVRPRMEIETLETSLEEAQSRPARGGGRALNALPGLGRVMPAEAPDEPDPAPVEGAAEEAPPTAEVVEGAPPAEGPPRRARREEFRMAIEAQELRRAQSRQALLEGAELDEEGAAEVDAILADMNDELMTHADTLMEIYVSGSEPTPREMLAISRDVTAILDDAQADLDRSLGAEAAAQLDEQTGMVWNHIDLRGFGPAVERALAEDP